MVPWVENAEQLAQAVAYSNYPRRGVRGIGAERATAWGRATAEHVAEADEHVLVVPIVESVTAAQNIQALVAVPGVGVAEGSIYPLLSRLKRQGLVTTRLEESREGPARKYYAATPAGRALAAEMDLYFGEMTRGLAALHAGGDFTGISSNPHTDSSP